MLNLDQPCVLYINVNNTWVKRQGYDPDQDRARTLVYPSFRDVWSEIHQDAKRETCLTYRVVVMRDGTTVHFWGAFWIMIGRTKV